MTKTRCTWAGDDPIYMKYHDTEWGVPVGQPSSTVEFSSQTALVAKSNMSSFNVSTDMLHSENATFGSLESASEQELPVSDRRSADQTMFEFLLLESAQAGLSWITILKRRQGYRRVFHDFDVKKVASMTESDIQTALQDTGIIRNKLKVRAAVKNAQVFMQIQEEYGTFCKYIWSFVGDTPVQNARQSMDDVPATTEQSDTLSADLKKRGMSFVGSTIMYAHMQATGLVNDHVTTCFRYTELAVN